MMKFKPNQTRTYDREGFKKRAACLCFRSELEDEVLLVSSSRYPDQWIVPGGGMEPEEEPGGAAVREVYEEAGVKGKLVRSPDLQIPGEIIWSSVNPRVTMAKKCQNPHRGSSWRWMKQVVLFSPVCLRGGTLTSSPQFLSLLSLSLS
uniref:diphosphoinositol-polyphosphate diphosphatase n=1 Tax=Castor canadensis TaxID=51338 RepID=A0A8C0WHG9_CASCN